MLDKGQHSWKQSRVVVVNEEGVHLLQFNLVPSTEVGVEQRSRVGASNVITAGWEQLTSHIQNQLVGVILLLLELFIRASSISTRVSWSW